nr:ribonuclease H-like domain-containing protein [Tanacetum cinerariifolium]
MGYALWDVIKNGKSIPKTQTVNNIEAVIPSTTTEEKLQRRNKVKARSTLMMGLPNEHQLKFNSFKDVKSLLEAIEKSNGVNTAQGVNTTNGVNTASSRVNAASSLNIDNLSDAMICAFLVSQPNNTHLVNEDLEQIHPDDLEEMDLKWQMAMLTIRARRFLKNTRRKLTEWNDFVAFDKTKVECYNFHKRGHFARECRAPRGHDSGSRDVKRTMPVETPNSSSLVSCDGLRGYDRSDQSEEGPTNYALMAYSTSLASSSDSEVSDDEEEKVEKKEVKPSINWINFVKSTTDNNHRETVKNGEQHKQNTHRKRALTVNVARQINVVHLKRTMNAVSQELYFSKQAHSFIQRPNQKLTTLKNNYANKKVKTIWVKKVNTAKLKAAVNAAKAKAKHNAVKGKRDYKEIYGGYVTFRGNPKGGKITGKGKIKSRNLDFENVYFVKELKFNLFSVSQICDKKNIVLFTDTECIVLSPNFKLIDDNQILLRVPRQKNMYIIDLKNIVPTRDHLGKFDRKADEGFFVGYSLNSKAFRVFNSRTKIMKENLHVSSSEVNVVGTNISTDLPPDLNMPSLEGIGIFKDSHDDEDVFDKENDKEFRGTWFGWYCYSKNRPQRPLKLLICLFHISIATQEGKRYIGSKWVFRNKMDEIGIVIRNKARLVAQEHTHEEGIDYDEVFAPVARIEAIRLFLAYASFKDVIVYQMDVKSAFLYGKIEEEVYVCQPPGFEDPNFLDKVYKVENALYGLHQAPRACFGVDVVEDFKEYTLRDYYWWLKTYCYWYKLKLLDNAADTS